MCIGWPSNGTAGFEPTGASNCRNRWKTMGESELRPSSLVPVGACAPPQPAAAATSVVKA